jgi:hypothetical protein
MSQKDLELRWDIFNTATQIVRMKLRKKMIEKGRYQIF